MGNVDYEAFLPQVRLEVAGCPEIILLDAVNNAAWEFFDKSWVWQVDLDPLTLMAGIADYDLDSPVRNAMVCRVLSVKLGDRPPLDERTPDWLDENVMNWRTQSCGIQYWTQLDEQSITFASVPDAENITDCNGNPLGVAIRAVLRPTRNATQIPQQFYERYLMPIAAGAKANLMMMPGQDWSNPQMGMAYTQAFEKAVAREKNRVMRGFSRAPIRTKGYYR